MFFIKNYIILFFLFFLINTVVIGGDRSTSDFFRKDTIEMTMSDGANLQGLMYMPVLQKDLTINISQLGEVVIAEKGLQYIKYPEQNNSSKLPVLFSRTPYNNKNSEIGKMAAVLGYCGIDQDMRGRYESEGTYYPMYSDSWPKTPYFKNKNIGHPLDKTGTNKANQHQDGVESLQYILNKLYRPDSVKTSENLISNGKVGMFGASALGNSQLQLAASVNNEKGKKGLKCLMPVVATGEFYNSAGFNNGVFREALISGWLGSQINNYNFVEDDSDNSVLNGIHSFNDFPAALNTPAAIREKAIDFWSTMYGAAYPGSELRPSLDISQAPVDANGVGKKDGKFSRYTNLDVPIYHVTGWWDIFCNGQIETWQKTMAHLKTNNRHKQKLIIGPFAHQTIGSRKTGDIKYPENVLKYFKIESDNFNSDNIANLVQSEIYDWFRVHLGKPEIILPESHEWQDIKNGFTKIRIPAEDYRISYRKFFNFLNGTGSLPDMPYKLGDNSNETNFVDIPKTGNSVFGDTTGFKMKDDQFRNFDASSSNGIANVRFYVVGPRDDGIQHNKNLGNYWYKTDTFPVTDVTKETKLYLNKNNGLSSDMPKDENNFASYVSDPDNPVFSIGGNNMVVQTPDGRPSQGQINMANPDYASKTMKRSDVIRFTSESVNDSFSIMGYPEAVLYAQSSPLSQQSVKKTNADFFVRILDVYPDGREFLVCEGAVNARYRKYAASIANGRTNENASISNIHADSVYQLHFRLLPIAYTWGKQHKIKILISSSLHPKYQSNMHIPMEENDFLRAYKNEDPSYSFNGTNVMERKAEQKIYFSKQYPSHVKFPVKGKNKVAAVKNKFKNKNYLNAVTISPNPVYNTLAIKSSYKIENIKIYNLQGSILVDKEIRNKNNIGGLDISYLEAGMYFLQVKRSNGQVITKKFIKK